jgi:hypothetical protein
VTCHAGQLSRLGAARGALVRGARDREGALMTRLLMTRQMRDPLGGKGGERAHARLGLPSPMGDGSRPRAHARARVMGSSVRRAPAHARVMGSPSFARAQPTEDRQMTTREDMTLDRLRRTIRRGGAKLEQCVRKRDLPRCGARCRSKGGLPCLAPVVVKRVLNPPRTVAAALRAGGMSPLRAGDFRTVIGKRCRMHGGLSTGPRTAEGRARCVEAGRIGAEERWRRYREGRGAR